MLSVIWTHLLFTLMKISIITLGRVAIRQFLFDLLRSKVRRSVKILNCYMEFSRNLLSTVCKLRLLLVRTVLLITITEWGAQLTLAMIRASLRTTQLLITLFLIMTVILTLVFSNTEFRPLRREVIRRNSRKIVIVTLTPLLFLLMTLLKIRIIILGQVAIRKALTRLISVSKFLVVGALWYRIILLVVVPSLLFSVRTVKYGAWRKIAVHLAPTS